MKKILSLLLVLVMVMSLAACGAKSEDNHIAIWFHGSTVTPEASEKVMAEVNKYVGEKLGIVIDPIWGTWGDFDTTVPQAMNAGDPVDIYFTCNWSANEYNKYAKSGNWVKLDELLPKYAPELLETIPQGIWDCAKTNGSEGEGIYAVPGLKDTATQNCWDVNATLLKELGYEVPAKLDYFSDEFEEMMAAAKKEKGDDFYPLLIEAAVLERMVDHSSIVTGDLNGANVLSYYYDAEHPANDIGSKIVNKFSTPEFQKYAERTYYFAQQGYIAPQCMQSATANDYRTGAQKDGAYLFGTQSYAFGCEVGFSADRGIEVVMVPETAPYMDCTSGQGAMMGISVNSKHPEKALEFLNLLNTDPVLMTMMNYGLEGFTYNKNEDGTISFIKEGRDTYSPWRNGMGNIRILPAEKEEGADYWERFSEYYDGAEVLPCGSFIYDSSAMETEAASIAQVYDKYAFNLMAGAVDPATELPKFLEELKAAGVDQFVEAANAQLAEYVK